VIAVAFAEEDPDSAASVFGKPNGKHPGLENPIPSFHAGAERYKVMQGRDPQF
jgi:hypothetical protein